MNKTIGHQKARVGEYPNVGDQLDAIFDGFKTLHRQGIDIGDKARKWVLELDHIKTKYKK